MTLCLFAPRNTCCGNRSVFRGASGWVQSKELDMVNWLGHFAMLLRWRLYTYLRYTGLTSPNKDETAVYLCDPALSVLVMLVSRNACHVVSDLQFVAYSVCTFFSNFLNVLFKCKANPALPIEKISSLAPPRNVMLQHLKLLFNISQIVLYGALKIKEHFKLLALKSTYSRSLMRDYGLQEVPSTVMTGKLLVFWKTGRRGEVVAHERRSQPEVPLYSKLLFELLFHCFRYSYFKFLISNSIFPFRVLSRKNISEDV